MDKISRSFGPVAEAEFVLLLGGEAGEEGFLYGEADEELAVLKEEAALVGEELLLVEGDEGAGGGAAVGDEEHVVFGVDEAVDGTHSDGLDGQVRVVLVVPQVELAVLQVYLYEHLHLQLTLVQSFSLQHDKRHSFRLLRAFLVRLLESEQSLGPPVDFHVGRPLLPADLALKLTDAAYSE